MELEQVKQKIESFAYVFNCRRGNMLYLGLRIMRISLKKKKHLKMNLKIAVIIMTNEQKVWSSFRGKRGKELHRIKKMPVYFLTSFYKL